jgi:hypothetical protein
LARRRSERGERAKLDDAVVRARLRFGEIERAALDVDRVIGAIAAETADRAEPCTFARLDGTALRSRRAVVRIDVLIFRRSAIDDGRRDERQRPESDGTLSGRVDHAAGILFGSTQSEIAKKFGGIGLTGVALATKVYTVR